MPRIGERFIFDLTWQEELGLVSVCARNEEPMKAAIEVKSKGEADAIRTGLNDPTTRAFVVTMGVLAPLTPKTRQRVLDFVSGSLVDESTKS